jgi:hypothetical protein
MISGFSAEVDTVRGDASLSHDQLTHLLMDSLDLGRSYSKWASSLSEGGWHASYFYWRARLGILSHRIYSSLYGVGGEMSWSNAQYSIRQFDTELQQ